MYLIPYPHWLLHLDLINILAQSHGTITILLICTIAYLLCISASHHGDLSTTQGKGRFGDWNEMSREEKCIVYKEIGHILSPSTIYTILEHFKCQGTIVLPKPIRWSCKMTTKDKRQLGRTIAND